MNRSGFAPTTTSIRVDYPWETLPMAQFELLMALQDNQPSRIGELANQLRLAPNTVSGLVQQLVDAGFVHRGPADRRSAKTRTVIVARWNIVSVSWRTGEPAR